MEYLAGAHSCGWKEAYNGGVNTIVGRVSVPVYDEQEPSRSTGVFLCKCPHTVSVLTVSFALTNW